MTVRIITGDCRTVLRTLPDESVHCVVTSPPYWGLRDYGVAGQLGLEGEYPIYVDHMVEVFREVRRVLRKDGRAGAGPQRSTMPKLTRPCDYNDGYDPPPPPPPPYLSEFGRGELLCTPIDSALKSTFEHLETRVFMTRFCESHIEVDMGTALVELAGAKFEIWPQFKLDRYRYDFAICRPGAEPIALVECDGKDFHSTPQQKKNDANKDAAARKAGLAMFRLTGAEIYADPRGVAKIILQQIRG